MRYFLLAGLIACGASDKEEDDNTQTGNVVEDLDGDGFFSDVDCDDDDDQINPGAEELCDGIDNNCNGQSDEGVLTTFYADADADGYGNPDLIKEACESGEGFVNNGSDCNDTDASAYPSAEEVCDGVDNDCDGERDEELENYYYVDADNDGFGDADQIVEGCELSDGLAAISGDCDDEDPQRNPLQPERCDTIDNNCDGNIDEGVTTTYYFDSDEDGYGDPNTTIDACEAPLGYVEMGDDCLDTDSFVYPQAIELCDDQDNDCDGDVDEDGSDNAILWYADTDEDGYGDANTTVEACAQPTGYVLDSTDCNDNNEDVSPSATEYCNNKDDDCDGDTDEDSAADATTWYLDDDTDGYGDASTSQNACTQPTGYVSNDDDCNDSDITISPIADEVCDSTDNDCDGNIDESDAIDQTLWYEDDDNDGYGNVSQAMVACDAPNGYVSDNSDCDDSEVTTYPGAPEQCDEIDNNCDGSVDEASALAVFTWYDDGDNDGYGDPNDSVENCAQPTGYVSDDTDCDDNDDDVNPGATEICSGEDDDCDGNIDNVSSTDTLWYLDDDIDGYGDPNNSVASCDQPSGYVANPSDCDDTNININPDGEEVCNTIDDNCDGDIDEATATDALTWYFDDDSDDYGDINTTTLACEQPLGYVIDSSDCDDTDGTTYPGADEICDGIDNDCDDTTTEIGTALCPATNCNEILNLGLSSSSGVYTIDPDGDGSGVETYCDMDTDGGGWTLAGYSYVAAVGVNSSNQNMKSLKCGGGSFDSESRSSSSAAIVAVVLAQNSTEMALSFASSNVSTGGLDSYDYAWKFTIPNPSAVSFVSHSYHSPTYSGAGACTAVTVEGIVGDFGTYTRYTLANSLGNTWSDGYPTGYGAGDSSSCLHENTGPFITSIHSGSHNYGIGRTTTECDIFAGSETYTYRGNYHVSSNGHAGSAALWFR
ncbi:MAG: MopE-related protein [Myxococcota bacterium]|nr:MopE-related protein [Myxococcota bacterium]